MFHKSLRRATIGLVALIATSATWSQNYPTKPVRIMTGFPAGGSADVVARIFGQKLSVALGQPVVVENRVGVGGSIAADHVAKSDPDGHRLLMLPSSMFVHSLLSKSVPYNIVRDFTPITYVAATPLVLVVNPAVQAQSVGDLISLARSKPGELTYGSEGLGAYTHLVTELFSQAANVKLMHVPFKGAMESTMATASGQITMSLPALTSALPLLKAERYRPLAVTSIKRSKLLPAVPTLDESGLRGFDQVAWYGFVGPAGMPKHVVERLHAAFADAASSPDVIEALGKQAMEIEIKSPEQFATFMRESAAQISRLAAAVNVKLD